MRSFVLRNHVNPLLRMSSVGVLGLLIAGCSSGFERFDTSYYDAGKPQPTAASNPYPGSVDPTTTASTSSSKQFAPVAEVGPVADPQGIYHRPEPTYAQPQYQAAQQTYQPYQPAQPTTYQPAQPAYQQQPYRQPLSGYQSQASSSWGSSQSIQSQPLAPTITPSYKPPKPDPVASSASTIPKTVYIAPKPDPVTTAAVQPVAPAKPRESGWTSTGGTTISVRQGETLYNLSKRYGVPASEIQRVNGLGSASELQAGQKVIIPNYVFSNSAPISAPDSDAKTHAARASTGYRGEAQPSKVAVPTHRPYYVAAVSPSGTTSDAQSTRYQPRTIVAPPSESKTPNHGITTSSVSQGDGFYVVKSGDSLSRVASRNGTTVSDLQRANGLTGTSIRIGQKLVIPAGNAVRSTTVAENKDTPVSPVDRMTTASIDTTTKKEEAAAPARTGISDFRWPVKGRVVGNFGEKTESGKNEGIDISVPEGTAVKAAENGVVIYAGSEISSYGNLVLVRHEDGWVSAYAHNRQFEVKKGDQVRRGQIIARSGKTGSTDRPKLHFELRKHSVPVNPTKHLAGA